MHYLTTILVSCEFILKEIDLSLENYTTGFLQVSVSLSLNTVDYGSNITTFVRWTWQ